MMKKAQKGQFCKVTKATKKGKVQQGWKKRQFSNNKD